MRSTISMKSLSLKQLFMIVQDDKKRFTDFDVKDLIMELTYISVMG